jgi:hypothetical protein
MEVRFGAVTDFTTRNIPSTLAARIEQAMTANVVRNKPTVTMRLILRLTLLMVVAFVTPAGRATER